MLKSILQNGLWYLWKSCVTIALCYTMRSDPHGRHRDAAMIVVGAHVGFYDMIHSASNKLALFVYGIYKPTD